MVNTLSNLTQVQTLAEFIDSSGALSTCQAVELVCQVATQVAILHRAGHAHGQITPFAITFKDGGRPMLDPPRAERFVSRGAGNEWIPPELRERVPRKLAETLNGGQSPTDSASSPWSREFGAAVADGPQSDVYALGAILCRLLTGESADAYQRSPRVKGRVPAGLNSFFDRAFGATDSGTIEGRIRDADGVLTALEHFLQSTTDVGAGGSTHRRDSEIEPVLEAIEPSPSCVSGVGIREGDEQRQRGLPDEVGLPFEKLGHYEIISRLGQGGMGEVYLGYERSLDRQVAIKVLPAQLARDPDLIRRFRAEATAAARLIHSNIIQIYFIGEDSGHQFFAMQYVDGMSLARLLAQHPRLTADEALAIIDEVLSGLVAAHKQGFVHRDIKPGNILIDRERRRALLADFGLVKSLEDSAATRTSTGVVLGTADYIAPEQGLGLAVDCRSDLYSTGVVLYQLLSGRLPFLGSESTAVIYQHVHEPPPPLRDLAPEVARALAAIVDKLLAKSPDNRYQTAAEALADVRAVRTGHSELTLPGGMVGDPTTAARPTRRATPGLIDTATAVRQPTHPGRATQTAEMGSDPPNRSRRRLILGLAAGAVPALLGGAWFALAPDDRARRQSRLTGQDARKTGELRQFGGHPSEINCFAVTSDEEVLIAGDRAGKLHIWDFSMGELRQSIRAHSGPIRRVIVLEDGGSVITCSADQTLKMWNTKTWKQITQFNGHLDVVTSVVQVPGRDEIISSSFDGTLIRWEMARGNPVARYGSNIHGEETPDFKDVDFSRLDRHIAWVRDVVIPAPGRHIISAGNDGALLVWDLESAKVVDRLLGQAGVIMCLAASPDGTRVLAGGYKKVICFWDLRQSQLIRRLPHDSATPACVAFSPDGRLALSGGADGVIGVWDVESGQRLHALEGHEGTVTSVRFMADGRRILSGGEDRTIRLWKLPASATAERA